MAMLCQLEALIVLAAEQYFHIAYLYFWFYKFFGYFMQTVWSFDP